MLFNLLYDYFLCTTLNFMLFAFLLWYQYIFCTTSSNYANAQTSLTAPLFSLQPSNNKHNSIILIINILTNSD